MEFSQAQKLALEVVPTLRPVMEQVGNAIWNFAETGTQEVRSAHFLAGLLEEQGFLVTRGVGGFPTGFIAQYKTGDGPVLALLCEYDALPALSCDAPGENGHGCGHNLFGSAAVGTALSLKQVMDAKGLKGTIRVYGTPGEENCSAKAYYVHQGLFDDVDCSVGFHCHNKNEVNYSVLTGTLIKNYIFTGQTAHAGDCPWEGRSALDAVEIMNVACNYLREHVPTDVRIQYIITKGGDAFNVVPGLAASQYCIRSINMDTLHSVDERVENCAKAAALATGCTYKSEVLDITHNLVLVREYAQLAQQYLEAVGAPAFSEQEQAAAKGICGGIGLSTAIEPLPYVEKIVGGASDEGDVSWVVPHTSIHVANVALNTIGHTVEYTKQANMPAAYTAMQTQVKATACMLVDLLENPQKVVELKAAHAAKMDSRKYHKNPDYRPDPKLLEGLQA